MISFRPIAQRAELLQGVGTVAQGREAIMKCLEDVAFVQKWATATSHKLYRMRGEARRCFQFNDGARFVLNREGGYKLLSPTEADDADHACAPPLIVKEEISEPIVASASSSRAWSVFKASFGGDRAQFKDAFDFYEAVFGEMTEAYLHLLVATLSQAKVAEKWVVVIIGETRDIGKTFVGGDVLRSLFNDFSLSRILTSLEVAALTKGAPSDAANKVLRSATPV